MPTMVMNRNWTVSSTTGYCVKFKKDEPVHIPQDLRFIQECQQYGAKFVDEEEAPDLPDEDAEPTNLPKSAKERRERIGNLLKEMVANQEAHRTHFTGQGRPQVKFVIDTLGFDVTAAEIEALWKPMIFPNEDE